MYCEFFCSLQGKTLVPDSLSPRIPPKTRSPLTTPKKRQSNIYELSSAGLRVSTSWKKAESRSLDDLDKLGNKCYIEEKHETQDKSSIKEQVTSRGGDPSVPDDETPPPLLPRKRRTGDAYDTLAVPPNRAHPVRQPPDARAYNYNTVDIALEDDIRIQPRSTKTNEGKHVKNLKHRYANLDEEIPESQQQSSTHDAFEDGDPYDVLCSPSRNDNTGNRNNVNASNSKTTYIDSIVAGRNPSNAASLDLTLKHQQAKNMHDTVVLRNSYPTNTNHPPLQSKRDPSKTGVIEYVSTGAADKPNGVATVYEYNVPQHLSSGLTSTTAKGNVSSMVSNFEELQDKSMAPPSLPPKKKDESVTSRHSTTLSPLVSQVTKKYSPPVAPRIKKPPKNTSNNNNLE